MENINDYISKLRNDYKKEKLEEKLVDKDPVIQFESWFKEAIEAKIYDPNAFVLSTTTKQGRPSSRVLLLRGFGADGFVFYTNYNSKKGKDILSNPYVSMLFFWPDLERQVRIEGVVEKHDAKASDEYFASRPYESQIGAWASNQSHVIHDRKWLDERVEELTKKYQGKTVDRPPHWGGFIIKPHTFEFWQGRPNRLHDRLQYNLDNGNWGLSRLSP